MRDVMWTAGHMNIDTLNAYCRPVLVTGLPLCQGRLYHIHQEIWFPALAGSAVLATAVGSRCTLQCRTASTLGILSRVVAIVPCSRVCLSTLYSVYTTYSRFVCGGKREGVKETPVRKLKSKIWVFFVLILMFNSKRVLFFNKSG